MFSRFVSASVLVFGLFAAPARAESPRFHGSALGAHAIGGHQAHELGFGAAGLVAGELPLAAAIGVQAELGALWLSEGSAPEDPRVEPGGDASSIHAAVGARLHPLGRFDGPWLAGAGGIARTGGLTRPMIDAGVGYDFAVSERFAMGPSIGFLHVFQPDGEFRPGDANVALAGVHFVFDPGPRRRTERRVTKVEGDHDPVLSVDTRDKCPNESEDKDDFEDDDGCPDPDNDQDGILDPKDLCPNEPETKNGYADEDGCPDSEQVRVVGDKIVLDDRVHFATNSAQIRAESHPLLERVAKLIADNPTYVHIEVEGHADERGPDWFNEKLSQSRAESVLVFLSKHGIERARLSAKGYGKSKPIAGKKGEFAWFMNRRVEFAITREVRK